MEYSVVLHPSEEGGYWAEVPALPGCYSQGESVEEAIEHVKEAIAAYLDVLRESGLAAPNDAQVVFRVQVPV